MFGLNKKKKFVKELIEEIQNKKSEINKTNLEENDFNRGLKEGKLQILDWLLELLEKE